MCNAFNHSASCNCGFGQRRLFGDIFGLYTKIAKDFLSQIFPPLKKPVNELELGYKVYDALFKKGKDDEFIKEELFNLFEKLSEPARETMSKLMWGIFEKVSKATKNSPLKVSSDKLKNAYQSFLFTALPLHIMYENKFFWQGLYGSKEKAKKVWNEIEKRLKPNSKKGMDALVSSEYSQERIHPVYGEKKAHRGIDLVAWGKPGVFVFSPSCGKVIYAGAAGNAGNLVKVAFPNDKGEACIFEYMHLANKSIPASLKKGDSIRENTLLGEVGNTGTGTGIHLHLGSGYVMHPDTVSVEIKLDKFNSKEFKNSAYYTKGILTLKSSNVQKFKTDILKLAVNQKDKQKLEKLFENYKPNKPFKFSEIEKMTSRELSQLDLLSKARKDIKFINPLGRKDEAVDSAARQIIRDIKGQLVSRKMSEEMVKKLNPVLKQSKSKRKKNNLTANYTN